MHFNEEEKIEDKNQKYKADQVMCRHGTFQNIRDFRDCKLTPLGIFSLLDVFFFFDIPGTCNTNFYELIS